MMKFISAVIIALLVWMPAADAASRYWVSGRTGNTNDTNSWGTGPGGTGAPASVPTTGDTAFFDTSGAVTINAALLADNIDMTGWTGSLSWGSFGVALGGASAAIVFAGTITGISGSSLLTLTGTGMTLTSNNKILPATTVNAPGGGVTLVDLLNISLTGNLTVLNGSLSANGVNLGASFSAGSGAGTRSITFGSQPWTVATSLDMRKGAGTLTLTDLPTSVIVFTPSSTPNPFVAWTDDTTRTYGTVKFNPTSVAGWTVITLPNSAQTVTNLTIGGGTAIRWLGASALTLTNSPVIVGTSKDRPIQLDCNSATAKSLASASNVTLSYALISCITASGGGTFSATNSFNGGNNTGWTITGPSGGGIIQ